MLQIYVVNICCKHSKEKRIRIEKPAHLRFSAFVKLNQNICKYLSNSTKISANTDTSGRDEYALIFFLKLSALDSVQC